MTSINNCHWLYLFLDAHLKEDFWMIVREMARILTKTKTMAISSNYFIQNWGLSWADLNLDMNLSSDSYKNEKACCYKCKIALSPRLFLSVFSITTHQIQSNAHWSSWLGMLLTCWRHAAPTAKCWHFWPTSPCRGDTKLILTQYLYVGDCRHSPLSNDIYIIKWTYSTILI